MSSTRCTRGSVSDSAMSDSDEVSGTESLEAGVGDEDGEDGEDGCRSKVPSDVMGQEMELEDDADEGRLEYEALMAINGALRRALSDRDAQLREMARRAKQEQRRLHEQLREATEAHVAEGSAAPAFSQSEASAGGDPAAGKVLKLTRRVHQMSQELRAQQKRTREAEAQARALQEQLLQLEAAPSDLGEEGGGDVGGGGGDSGDGGDEGDGGSVGDGTESGGGGAGAAAGAAAAGGGGETLERVNEQLHRTTQRLVDLRSQNMQLRHDLMLAKKVLAAEVGEAAAAAALAASGGWKGRSEQTATLAQRASEMQEQLQQLRQECMQMRQQLKESSSTEDEQLLRPVTQVAVTPREVSPPVASLSTLLSVPDAGGAAGAGGGAGAVVARAAVERRAAAEAAAREARAAAEAADWQADLHRAHNVALEANGHALRERVAQLLAKAQHDKQLAQAVTEQVNAAETQVRNRERKLELLSENFAQERRMLQQQLVRSKSVAAHLQGVLAEKEKVLKDLSGCSREIDERESARLRAKNRGNVSSATRAREDRARAAMLRVVLNGRSAERARLQHLVDHLDRRMADKQQELHATNEALRSERQRTASLETDIARLELQRGGGGGAGGGGGGGGRPAGGGGSGRDRTAPDDFRSRLYLMEEENEALRARLERLFAERDDELRTYAAILDPKKALATPTRAASSTGCSAGPAPAPAHGHRRSSGCEARPERRGKRPSASVGRLGRGRGARARPVKET